MKKFTKHFLVKLFKKVIVLFMCVIFMGINQMGMAQLPVTFTQGRIALSHDGNINDKDDILAVSMIWPIIASCGVQSKLVHVDVCNNLKGSDAYQYQEMLTSLAGRSRFPGFPTAPIYFDDQTQLAAAIANFKKEAEAGNADNKLFLLCAGPMEVPWRMINAVNPAYRKFIHCISHNSWNNDATPTTGSHTWQDMINSFSGDGTIFQYAQGAITGLGTANWSFMNSMPSGTCISPSAFAWVTTRDKAGDGGTGDCSDDCMLWYLLTGDRTATAGEIQQRFLNPICNVGPQYTITASAGSNGSINPSGSVLVDSATNKAFTITANSGYQVNSVTVDGVSQGSITSYTFNNVTANHSISATFSTAPPNAIPWTEAFSYANGTTSHGAPTAWTATNMSVQNNEISFNNVGADGVFTTGPIDISSGPVNVSLNVRGGSGLDVGQDFLRLYKKVDGGAEVLIDAADGLQPAEIWTGNIATGNSLVLVLRAHVTATTEYYYFDNLNVTAGTPPVTYTLTTTAINGTITRNLVGPNYAAGTVVTLTPLPNSGYLFSGWSGDLTGSTNPGSITMNANKSVTANFTQITGCVLPWTDPGLTVNANVVNNTYGPINISCAANGATISVTLQGVGADASDYCRVYYKVDGGAQQTLVAKTGAFATQTFSVPGIVGTSVQIIVQAATSWADEFYYITNLSVADAPPCTDNLPWTKADITVNNLTITNQSQGVVNTSCASSVTITADVEGLGGLDLADYCRMQYKVNGGTTLQPLFDINNLAGAFTKKLFSKTVTATSVELVLNAKNTFADEIYKITNIKITSNGLKSASIATNIEMANAVEDGLRIYPNPASGILNIDFPNAEISREIKVFNMVGQLIHRVQTKNSSAQIDVQALKLKGVAIVQIVSGNTISSHRIIVK